MNIKQAVDLLKELFPDRHYYSASAQLCDHSHLEARRWVYQVSIQPGFGAQCSIGVSTDSFDAAIEDVLMIAKGHGESPSVNQIGSDTDRAMKLLAE